MSSHHIVREKQEPTLFIQSLTNFDEEHLGQLLEWSPVVLVSENEYERVHALGIKMDAVLTASNHLHLQEHIQTVLADENELESALKYLVTNGHSAVNVVTDVFSLKESLFFAGKINLVVLCLQRKIYPVKNGFSKWLSKDEDILLHNDVQHLQTEGLEKMDERCFKTLDDGFISLKFEGAVLFISESL